MQRNKDQVRAINHNDGPAIVIASAGTGKTAAITSRIVRIISDKKAEPDQVLALTFTDKAASEMEERVELMLPQSYAYADLWISTFHSFCDRILRDNGLSIGIPVDYKIIEGSAIWILIRKNIDKFNFDYYKSLGNPSKFINSLIDHFSRCKDQGIGPKEYLSLAKKVKEDKDRALELAKAYETYQKILIDNNYLDFGDVINYSILFFKKRPLILKKYREQFKYILIDEFQDTNSAQYELIKLLSTPKNNLMICLDPNQSIYQWRGASTLNIDSFKKDYPEFKEIVLSKNYRSLQNILDVACRFIDGKKGLSAHREGEGVIEHLHFKTSDHEYNGVVGKIKEIKDSNKNLSFSDFAVLARSNSEANKFARTCERLGMPYEFLSSKGLYQKPIILDVIAYFNLLDNYHENSAVYRSLNFPFLKISGEEIAVITRYAHKNSISVYTSLKEIESIPGISKKTVKKIQKLMELILYHTELSLDKNISEVFISFLQKSEYLKFLAKKGEKEDIEYINLFYNRIKSFEESSFDPKLKNFMEELNLEIESGDSGKLNLSLDLDSNAVKIMTAHKAKGLEFRYVFIISLVDRKFPTDQKSNTIELIGGILDEDISQKDIHMQEERRLFYVAMTRAMDGLFFTSANDYGGVKNKKVSRFLIELGYSPSLDTGISGINLSVKKKVINKEKYFLPDYFSFTQLATFSKCPLQYKFAHILKIPLGDRPNFVFGKSMHNSIHNLAEAFLEKKISLKEAYQIYEKNWINEWYRDRKERDDYYKLGKDIIKNFYKDFSENRPKIFLINNKPAFEQKFSLKIGGYYIKGKIDRIDEFEDGIEVIDYKTGSFKEKLTFEEKSQLFIYQIALQESLGIKVNKLTYYYLNEGRLLSFKAKDSDLEKTRNKVIENITNIKNSNFNPTPGWNCRFCDFNNICEYAVK